MIRDNQSQQAQTYPPLCVFWESGVNWQMLSFSSCGEHTNGKEVLWIYTNKVRASELQSRYLPIAYPRNLEWLTISQLTGVTFCRNGTRLGVDHRQTRKQDATMLDKCDVDWPKPSRKVSTIKQSETRRGTVLFVLLTKGNGTAPDLGWSQDPPCTLFYKETATMIMQVSGPLLLNIHPWWVCRPRSKPALTRAPCALASAVIGKSSRSLTPRFIKLTKLSFLLVQSPPCDHRYCFRSISIAGRYIYIHIFISRSFYPWPLPPQTFLRPSLMPFPSSLVLLWTHCPLLPSLSFRWFWRQTSFHIMLLPGTLRSLFMVPVVVAWLCLLLPRHPDPSTPPVWPSTFSGTNGWMLLVDTSLTSLSTPAVSASDLHLRLVPSPNSLQSGLVSCPPLKSVSPILVILLNVLFPRRPSLSNFWRLMQRKTSNSLPWSPIMLGHPPGSLL